MALIPAFAISAIGPVAGAACIPIPAPPRAPRSAVPCAIAKPTKPKTTRVIRNVFFIYCFSLCRWLLDNKFSLEHVHATREPERAFLRRKRHHHGLIQG